MRTFARRRSYNILALLGATFAGLLVFHTLSLSLHDIGYVSGWGLLGLMVLLVALNARKKLPFLPLWSATAWLQLHVYAGLFSVAAFAIHTEFRTPNGVLESTLAIVFGLVAGSGVVGLWLTRAVPVRLSRVSEQVLFERQPVLRRQLRQQLTAVVGSATSPSLKEFYAERLIAYFAGPRDIWSHLRHSNRPRRRLLMELDALGRYLSDDDRGKQDEMARLIRAKSELDYQFAHHAVLKYWLFGHIPLSYSLLILAVVHAAIAYAFGMSVP